MVVLLFIFSYTKAQYVIPSVTIMPTIKVCEAAVKEIKDKKHWSNPEAYCKEVKK